MEALTHSSRLMLKMRADARAIFLAGVEAVEPARAVTVALRRKQATLDEARRVVIVAIGGAARLMAEAAIDVVGQKAASTVVVVCGDDPCDGARALTVDHGAGIQAALQIEEAVSKATLADLVLLLVSAGGPAMLCAPVPGIEPGSKARLQDMLHRAGADMKEIVTVRNAVSRFSNGGLVQRMSRAKVLSLILSEASGDDLLAIANGPAARLADQRVAALAVIAKYGLMDVIDPAIVEYIRNRSGSGATRFAENVENLVIGSNGASLKAAADRAMACHGTPLVGQSWLDDDIARAVAELHRNVCETDAGNGPVALVCGRIASSGRNQEFALRFALLAERKPVGRPWVLLSGNTAGRCGSGKSAGAVVDAGSCAWMRQLGFDPALQVASGDPSPALAASGDLLFVGDTVSNVTDIHLVLLA